VAQKVEVVLTCDLDERSMPAVETVQFSYNGQPYEFELCADHLKEFHELMQRYASAARPTGRGTGGGRGRAARPARRASGPELTALRAWAQENGYAINERGRIPLQVRKAYEEANA